MENSRCRLLLACAICVLQNFSELHAEFVTTIHAPPAAAPSLVPSDTQLNLSDGAQAGIVSAGERSGASNNVEVNIFGGSVDFLQAYRGSTVNISGGNVKFGGAFGAVAAGSTIHVSGGTIGDGLVASNGSLVRLIGGEFRLDGVLVDGLGAIGSSKSFNLPDGKILSGTFADGTPFAFSSFSSDDFPGSGLTLATVQLPAISPALITTPSDPVPLGVRVGQTLVVATGGAVGDSFNAGLGSALEITGGTIGNNLEAVGATVQMSAGSIGDSFDAYNGTRVLLSGGSIGSAFQVTNGSHVTISGGSVGYAFAARSGSTVDVSGGSVGFLFTAQAGSQVSISGGSIGQAIRLLSGAQAVVEGYDFRLDGQPISGLSSVGSTKALNLSSSSVLSGTLADGTPFVFTGLVQDQIADGTLTLRAAVPLAETLTVFHVPTELPPLGLRANQTLFLESGGNLPDDFTAGRASQVQINGGQVGLRMEAEAAEVNIAGGTVGSGFRVYNGSVVNIEGGTVDPNFGAYNSTVNVSGTANVTTLYAENGSRVHVSGGLVRSLEIGASSGVANVTGGIVESLTLYGGDGTSEISGGIVHDLGVLSSGKVKLVGGDFRLDGVPISGLETPGNSVVQNVGQRSVLTGVLTDGTPFAYFNEFSDQFRDGALTLTAAPIPNSGPPDVTLPGGAAPPGLRTGQTLVVDEGGTVGDYFTASLGSTLVVSGGHVGDRLRAVGSHVTILDGSIGDLFYALPGAQVDLQGGKIGFGFFGAIDSEINITGGTTGEHFALYTGSRANISGGSVGGLFQAQPGSEVKLVGGDFLLDGVPIQGFEAAGSVVPLNLPESSVLSGTLADGTPIVFSSLDGDQIADGTLTLQAAGLPAIGPSIITLPGGHAPQGIRNGQTLVMNGGTLEENFTAGPGSRVEIKSGQVSPNLEAIGAVIDISGGMIGENLGAFAGSTVNISGGEVGRFSRAFAGSRVNISGGQVGYGLDAFEGSEVNVSGGGLAGIRLQGGQLNVSGNGSVADITGSGDTNVSGGTIGRIEISDARLNISGGTFSGIFYIYSNTVVDMSGGQVGDNFNLFPFGGIVINLTGGSLGDRGIAHSGEINISGGSLGNSFQAFGAVDVNISGGTIGDHFIAFGASKINIAGGTIGHGFDARSGSVINISGGEFGAGFDALSGSHINIFGRAFALDGVPIGSSLQFEVPFTIAERNVELSGILLDGTPFSFDLNSSRIVGQDFFDRGAMLTVTLVPEPSTLVSSLLALALFGFVGSRQR